jgi:hypothetical protein
VGYVRGLTASAVIGLLFWLALGPATTGALASASTARSCGWLIEPTANAQNILFPDTGTEYLGAVVPVPPGGSVEITGEFPHARYMSFVGYTTTLQPTTHLYDAQIVPDPGSSNPFLPGADRNVVNRSYTIHIVSGKPPASGGAPNTIYTTNSSGQSGSGFAYRIYSPDNGTGQFGGVPAPVISVVLSNGTKVTLPTCSAPPSDALLTSTLAGAGFPNGVLPAAGVLAAPTPAWHKYVNAPNGYAQFLLGGEHVPTSVQSEAATLTAELPAGLGENPDNKYVFTDLSREFGEVVEFRAKLPTTPHTLDGEATMGTGQLRYWSMCTGNTTTQTLGCTMDEQTPIDRAGDFTVVVSTAADRPADATLKCGIAWLPWGAEPQGVVLMRNMLPSPSFAQAIQNVTPGDEKAVMGDYYPTGRYFATPTAFQKAAGCPAAS